MAGISFVRVVDAGPGYTTVLASDGNTYTLQGDRNWRNNNPGNLEYGPLAKSQGAIGSDGRFAIFPDVQTGAKAQEYLQFQSPKYRGKTVLQAIEKYAPRSENPTDSYANSLAYAAGVDTSALMGDLTPKQRAAYLAQQRKVEGFRPGKIKAADGKSVPPEVVQQFKGAPLPPAPINPLDSGLQLASFQAGRIPLPAPSPLTPESMGGSLVDKLPQTAMYGLQRRLTPGKVTQPPTDFTTADLGNVDPRTLGMMAPPTIPRGVPMTGNALKPISQLGVPMAGGATGLAAPMPMPAPSFALPRVPAPPVPQQSPPRVAQAAPQAPAQPMLRLASGKMIAPGVYNQGDHSVQVSDAGDGTAKISMVRGPMAIPGVFDPLKEVNAPTIVGGMIRNMIPKVATDAVQNFNAPAAVDNVKSAAANAASNLGASLGGFGSGITGAFSGLGGLFGGARPPMPMFPTQAQMQAMRNVPASAYYPPRPMNRPLFAVAAPQQQRVALVAPVPVRTPNSVAVIGANDPDRYAQQVFGNPNGGAFGGSLAGF